MKILILAGGFATRLWPLSQKRAKPLLLINGKTILAHLFEKIPENYEVILITNKKFEKSFQDEIKKIGKESQTTIFCEESFSDAEKLGALRAVSLVCKELQIDENIFVFAGDNLLPELDLKKLSIKDDQSALIVREVSTLAEARKFGVVSQYSEKQKGEYEVSAFAEKPHAPKSKLVSTGFLSIGKNLLPILHAFAEKHPDNLGNIFGEFLRKKKTVIARKVSGEWFDIGSFETYLEAHKKIQEKNICQASQEKNNTFSGKIFIGEGSEIKDSVLHNVIVYPNTNIENCILSNCIIDTGCELSGIDLNQKLIRQNTILKNS